MNSFFQLLQTAIGAREGMTDIPASREDWEELFKVCGQHNLLGITFPVIDALHDEVEVPLGVYSRWAMVAEKTVNKNRAYLEACRKLYGMFTADGFECCIMKGQAAASLYPRPELRQCGDIDLWAGGGRVKIMDYLRSRYEIKKVLYIHCDARILKGISVEVHFTPSWFNSPFGNRRLQRFFESESKEQFGNFDTTLGFSAPTLRFNAVYMLVHIYRHVLEAGIGLRQLLDYYYVLQHLPASDRQAALSGIRQLGLLKFAAGVMYVLREVFCLDADLMLVEPDARLGSFLLDEIMLSGNFGRFDPRMTHESDESRMSHIRNKVRRAFRFLKYFPSEVFWMPGFMVWQYFWRRKNNYLYKGR